MAWIMIFIFATWKIQLANFDLYEI